MSFDAWHNILLLLTVTMLPQKKRDKKEKIGIKNRDFKELTTIDIEWGVSIGIIIETNNGNNSSIYSWLYKALHVIMSQDFTGAV